jgi:hypothetical protein
MDIQAHPQFHNYSEACRFASLIWNLLPGKVPVILCFFFCLATPLTVPEPGSFRRAMVAEFSQAAIGIE